METEYSYSLSEKEKYLYWHVPGDTNHGVGHSIIILTHNGYLSPFLKIKQE